MSTTIDERVVQMSFDNKEFENNVRTSMSTIERLKQSLNFSGASRGLENVSAAARGVDMSGLSSAVDTVRLKFSAMEVAAMAALSNIVNSAMNAGKRIISSLTIDPITTGFSEYETQMNAVQTILSNTSGAQTEVNKEAVQAINEEATASMNATVSASQTAIAELKSVHSAALDEFADAADDATDALNKAQKQESKAFQKTADSQLDALQETHKQELEAYQDAANAKLDALNAQFDAELDALEDKYDAESEALSKSIKEELRAFKNAHEEKLALFEEEYLEKLRLTDEERYNKLKAIDDEIAALKGLTNAEQESNEEAERSRKLAELQYQVDNAIGLEERIKAETALANYKKRIAEEDILKEREAKIETLEASKDAVNEEYDLIEEELKSEYQLKKKQAQDLYELELENLKDEQAERQKMLRESYEDSKKYARMSQSAQKEALQEQLADEKEAITERHDAEVEALKEQQELEKEALQEQHDAEDKALKKQIKAERNALLAQQEAELAAMDENLKVALENIELEKSAQIKALSEVAAASGDVKATTLDDVNAALDELNEYADRTIYNFTEMTRNIGTFTAAGVDLDTSVAAIKGIANLAAVSGSSSQQASTAMYQLSQAISSGTVRLMDWNSVQNAGMGGKVFQNALLETARVHGIAVDEMIAENGSFRDSLQEGWLSSDILLETLQKFTGDLTEAELEAMGYNEEQIKGIIKLGEDANDAATKVKTFTQLMDTLKEAAQSGWSQTWRTIVGDFEEAKELWGEASEAFGGMIEESSRLRNDMLKGWKDLGGREALIDSIRNAFKAIGSIITPIKEAFREIFPRTTSEQLFKMTESLQKFTEGLILTGDQQDMLKRTFKGLFAVLDIVKTAFVSVWNAIKPLFSGTGTLVDNVLKLTSRFGDWLIKLRDTVEESKVFDKALQRIKDVLKTVIDYIKNFTGFDFSGIVSKFTEFINKVKENVSFPGLDALSGVLSTVKEYMSGIGESANDMKTKVGESFSSMGESIANSKVVQFLKGFWNGIKAVVGGIGKVIGDFTGKLGENFNDLNLDTVLEVFKTLTAGGVAIAITAFITNLTKPFKGLDDIFKNINKILDGVRGCFKAYQNELNASALLKIAGAVAVLVAAIVVISLIDPAKVKDSLSTVTLLLAELVGAIAIFSKISGSLSSVTSASIALVAISAALLILTSAISKMAGMTDEALITGFIGLAAMSAIMVVVAKSLSGVSAKLITASIGLIAFTAALALLVPALALFGLLPLDKVGKGLLIVAGALTVLIVALNSMKASTLIGAAALMVVAAAITVLVPALALMGALPLKVLAKGVGTIAAALAVLVVGLNSMKTGAVKGAAALVVVAAALLVLTPALAALGSLPLKTIGIALLALVGVFVVFGVAAAILTPLVPTMVALAGSLALLGVAALGIGAALLVAGLGLSALALGFAELALAGTAGAVVLGSALVLIVTAVASTIAIVAAELAKGIVTFVQVIADAGPSIRLVLLTILTDVVATIVGAVPVIGAGVLAILSDVLLLLIEHVPTIVDSVCVLITSVLNTISEHLPDIITAACNLVVSFCQGITDNVHRVAQAGVDMIISFIDAIATALLNNAEAASTAVWNLIWSLVEIIVGVLEQAVGKVMELARSIFGDGFIDGIISMYEAVKEKVQEFLANAISVIAEKISEWYNAGKELIAEVISGIAEKITAFTRKVGEVITAGVNKVTEKIREWYNAGKDLIAEVISGIGSKLKDIKDSVVELISNAKSAVTDKFEEWKSIGKDLIQGFIGGIKQKAQDIKDAALGVIEGAVDKIKSFLGINSPSRLFMEIGRYSDEGLAIGLNDYSGEVTDAAESVADGAVSTMSKVLAGISDVLNSDMDTSPTIRPVLDTSSIEAGANRINALFSKEQAMSINTNMHGVDGDGIQNGANSKYGATYQFTQNNYSPKALSRVEIYRQTRNQFSAIERMATP